MSTLKSLNATLKLAANAKQAEILQKFFKTGPGQYGAGDKFLGIKVPPLRAIAHAHADLELDDLQKMMKAEWHEERLAALMILVRRYEKGNEAERQAIFDFYAKNTKRINNWDLVDLSAPQIVGQHLERRDRSALHRWAKSELVWERRIAVVATHWFIKKDDFADTLKIVETLLGDGHDLIHKACGWMLREVGKRDKGALEEFIGKHCAKMPRTALRYAIERFPEEERKEILEREE